LRLYGLPGVRPFWDRGVIACVDGLATSLFSAAFGF
jgi:hypothetical protein